MLKVAETSPDGVSASNSSRRDLRVSQHKAVGIHGDVGGRVEVGDLGDQRHFPDVEAGDDNGQPFVFPGQLADPVLRFLTQRLDTLLENG